MSWHGAERVAVRLHAHPDNGASAPNGTHEPLSVVAGGLCADVRRAIGCGARGAEGVKARAFGMAEDMGEDLEAIATSIQSISPSAKGSRGAGAAGRVCVLALEELEFRSRGLLLIAIHTLWEALKSLSGKWELCCPRSACSPKQLESLYELFSGKFHILRQLFSWAAVVEEGSEMMSTVNASSPSQKVVDEISVKIQSMEGHHFLRNFGSQYSDGIRKILPFLMDTVVAVNDSVITADVDSQIILRLAQLQVKSETEVSELAWQAMQTLSTRKLRCFWSLADENAYVSGVLRIVEPSIQMAQPVGVDRMNGLVIPCTKLEVSNEFRFVFTVISDDKRVQSFTNAVLSGQEAHAQANVTPPPESNIIVHFHGGGFIAQYPKAHEVYTRRWSVRTGATVFSVNYAKAPLSTFPEISLQCFEAYKWICDNSHRFTGRSPSSITIAGDSAGGNLSASVLLRALDASQSGEDVTLPDGAVLAYPALFLSPVMSPSRLLSVIDPMINITFLQLCVDAYTGKEAVPREHEAYLSPLLASDEQLARFPNLYITVGSLDPLLDEALQLAARIKRATQSQQSGPQVRVEIFDSLPHGFLMMHTRCNESLKAVDCAADGMKTWMKFW